MKPLGYTCKYTPLELLEALGGHPVLLNQESCGFPYAERVTHNQFCCHAKAVLEEYFFGEDGIYHQNKADYLARQSASQSEAE